MKTGTVTLLFTDLVGSSELIERLGDDAADRVRRRYFRLLRDSVQRCGGDEVKSLGDGLMVVFPSAVDAVSCAVAMQQSLHDHNSEHQETGLHLRVGLHAGEPVREGDDFFGQSVVIAKRICDGAQAGQIVVSELVHDIVGSRGDFIWKELGWIALKGVATPVSCCELAWSPAPVGSSHAPVRAPRSARRPTRSAPVGQPPPAKTPPVASPRLQAALAAAVTLGLVVAGILAVDSKLSPQSPAVDTPEELTWAEVDPSTAGLGGRGNQRINRLLAFEGGFIAVGEDDSSGRPDAAVWTSAAGSAWTRRAAAALTKPGGQGMLGVASGGPGFVAVGYRGHAGTLDAAVWTSKDGREWSLVEGDSDLEGARNEVMNRVAQTEFGLVAVGYRGGIGGDRDAAAWVSDNGLAWHRARVPEERNDDGTQEMRGIAARGENLVAVGQDGLAGNYDAAVWFSKNGTKWQRREQSPSVFGGRGEQIMTSVVASDTGFVGVGWSWVRSDLDAQVWTSQDGMDWSPLPYDEAVFGGDGDQLLWGVELSQGTFIAVGRDDFGGGSDAAVWISEDGFAWSRTAGDESIFGGDRAQEMRFVAAAGPRLVGAGWDDSNGKEDAAIWWAEFPGR